MKMTQALKRFCWWRRPVMASFKAGDLMVWFHDGEVAGWRRVEDNVGDPR